MKARLALFWHHYLQTTLGLLGAFGAMFEYIDAETINLMGTFFGPKYGPIVSTSLRTASSLLVAYRAMQARRERPPP